MVRGHDGRRERASLVARHRDLDLADAALPIQSWCENHCENYGFGPARGVRLGAVSGAGDGEKQVGDG